MVTNPLLARLNGELIAVAGESSLWFESSLQQLASHPRAEELCAREEASSADDGFWPAPDDWRASLRPYKVKEGVLYVPVQGVLLNRFSYQLGHWATGYTYIERAVRRGMEDPEVEGIAFVYDTPGGEVSGCFELADKLFEWRGTKPMWAFAADRGYSAGYALASTADVVTMVRTGGVGSIGVVTLHLDFSEQLDQLGIKATYIQAGKYKTDGNHLQPLAPRAKQRIQSRIDSVMDIFVSSVARNRNLSEQAIRDFEADCFTAQEALANGLADRVEIFEEAVMAFTELCTTGSGETDMTKPNEPQTYSQAQLDEATATATASGKAEGVREGATAERARVVAILGCDEAKKRGKAALQCALQSEMTVDQAKAFLAGLDEESKPAATTEQKPGALAAVFDAAMGADAPNVGAGDPPAEGDGDKDAEASQKILGAFRAATGYTKPVAKAAA